MKVTHRGGDAYEIDIRGHRLLVDQPAADHEQGPSPTELFAASLASCVAFYAGTFLQRNGVSMDGFEVRCDFQLADDRPSRVGTIRIEIRTGRLSDTMEQALARVAAHCTVHNSLVAPPLIEMSITACESAA